MIAKLEKSGRSTVVHTHDSRMDVLGKLMQWLGIVATSQEGPWTRERHYSAALTNGSSDASSVAWGGVVKTTTGTSPQGECSNQSG